MHPVPPALRASSGVEAGTGPYSFGSYTQDRILSAIRGTVMMLATPQELAKARADAIAEIAPIRATLVLYESGPRLSACLTALADGLGDLGVVM